MLISISLIFVSSVAAADLANENVSNVLDENNEAIMLDDKNNDVELTSDENFEIYENNDAKLDDNVENDSIEDAGDSDVISEDAQLLSSVNEEKASSALDNSTHYGYWLWSKNIPDVNLTHMANNGVTDLILTYYAFEAHNKTFVEDLVAAANEKGIRTHIWVQIFYEGSWTRPISREGVVNYDFFNEKIEEIKGYVNTTGIAGIHYDYLRFSGSKYYNNTAYQNPGGMEAITYFVNESAKVIREINPDLVISAAIMPETDDLAKIYGVDYPEISKIFDVIVPMVYTMNFHNDTQWVKDTTKWFVENSNGAKIWTGLMAYTYTDTDEEVCSNVPTSQMNVDIAAALESNATGVMLFRVGQCNDIDFNNLSVNESVFNSFSYLNYIISTEKEPVELKNDFAFDEYFDGDFTNGIIIQRNKVKVNGANHTVDAKGVASILNITGNNTLVRNFIFVNASADLGAVTVSGNGSEFINCTFVSDNAASGVVRVLGNNTVFTNCTFISDNAAGEVIYVKGNSTEFNNCTFICSELLLVTPQKATYIINYDGKYSVILLDSNGEPVKGKTIEFVLNGKDIGSATTDANGTATIKIASKTLKNAKSGKKNLVIKYTDAFNQPVSKTVKVTVDKEKTKLTAKAATFKTALKTKKYSIVLKDSKNKAMKNVKVTLKVKGKTYNAKTNSKGKATFKITKLTKKGTFKANVKYAGNTYYKAVSKTVKIKNK